MDQKTRRRDNLDIFSLSKNFVEEKGVEASDNGIDQRVKNHLINLQCRFSKDLPEAVNDKINHGSIPCSFAPKLRLFHIEEDERR
jgi:hypothetical protein